MMVIEVIQQVEKLKPTALRRQSRINNLVRQRMQSAENQPPSKADVVLAQFAYDDLRRQTDSDYIKRLQRQLVAAKAALGK